ncbi:trimethylguanosine synthase [Plodia interpunctella]|uniref:trimethylguanosine synthase n=1 Tax=Plodia interpunctella TaxID=58824 RepID=UPI0023688263|nr:trimethylguanosine synthase [Plodia interpunctella]
MMSEYYDHYHRWEPLAEFHFAISDDSADDDYIYCLCSRVFLRDGLKTYFVDKGDASESDVDVQRDSHSQEWEDQSHVHFSLDTSYKVKCEKDEGASCYCSASHTDNYCSTDEHDPAQIHGTASHALQPSDSGADLTYQDCHSDYTTLNHEKMDQDFPSQNIAEFNENYLSEDSWEQFWAINGERIIWASWIKKYSDYINPAYLNENNELILDENNLPKQHSADQIFTTEKTVLNNADESLRERKFSYDSKVNPYKKSHSETVDKANVNSEKDDLWMPMARKRSCSEHDRIVSPRTVITGTDSMTNVTKITLSSYDITSSHVTSESSPTEDYSVSSSTSDDQSNDQTRIANVNESIDQTGSEELDTEEYWQFLWKKHFGEQYALHYANYIDCYNNQCKDLPAINVETVLEAIIPEEKVVDIECENSEGNSQEMPTIIEVKEVEEKVDKIKLDDKSNKPKKRSKKVSNRYMGSVGVLLQNLLKEEQRKSELDEVFDAGEGGEGSKEPQVDVTDTDVAVSQNVQPVSNSFTPFSYDEGDDDPPEDKPVSLKRSHEIDEDEIAAEKIQSTFQIMGFSIKPGEMPKGQLVYRRRLTKLRPPRSRKFGVARKTYFDDEGNPYQSQESNEEREMQTDEEVLNKSFDTNQKSDETTSSFDVLNRSDDTIEDNISVEAANVDLPPETLSDGADEQTENAVECTVPVPVEWKRRRRNKRHARAAEVSEMPDELKDDPKMYKYWKKRHSLFYRFDEGIKLDRESWFSVTPENVASHIAEKCSYDVVLDAFCGAGGNTIQFARTCKKVIAMDIDPVKIEMARHNARVYGVDNIEFIVGDYFRLAADATADMVFLSPPWGGPTYKQNSEYNIETMLQPKPASELMAVTRKITSNIALYLPRNTRTDQLLALAKNIGGSIEIEQSYLDRRFVAITAYFYD